MERYGDENYNNREKALLSIDYNHIAKVAKQTKMERYGDENYNNREKMITTKIAKYGTTSPGIEKARQTLFNKYGVTCSLLLPQCRERAFSKESLEKANHTRHINGTIRRSSYEILIYNFIRNNYNTEIKCNDRTILNGNELDLYFPEVNKAIEIQGDYYHANPLLYNANDIINKYQYAKDIWEKDKNKQILAESKNIQILYIWEYDILHNLNCVYENINNFLK